MNNAQILAERLRKLGFQIQEPFFPARASYSAAQRTAGGCTWFCRVIKDGKTYDLLSWCTMRECVRCPVEKWDLELYNPPWGIPEYNLDVPQEYWLAKRKR